MVFSSIHFSVYKEESATEFYQLLYGSIIRRSLFLTHQLVQPQIGYALLIFTLYMLFKTHPKANEVDNQITKINISQSTL